MKLQAQSSELETVVSAACTVARGGDPIQIIAERLDETSGETSKDTEERPPEAGRVRVIAYNDVIVSEWRCGCEISMNGSVAINPAGLERLIKASKSSESTIGIETAETDNAQAMRLATSRSAHEFPSVSEHVFESIRPGRTDGPQADLSNLARAISTAKIAATARGDAIGTKAALSGVHIRPDGDDLDIVGTDGLRLALCRLRKGDYQAIETNGATGFTLPPESFGLLTNLLSSGSARVTVSKNTLIVESPNASLSIRMIDLQYPAYTQLLSSETENRITLPKQDLEIALQRSSVALMRDRNSVAVKLSRGQDGLHMSSSVSGHSSSECLSETPGSEVQIGFDATFMSQALAPFAKSDIDLDFTGTNEPIRVTSQSNPDITMLVMPCRVN